MCIVNLKTVLVFSAAVFIFSLVYFVYASFMGGAKPHEETFLDEIGEVFGGLGLVALAAIYGRTVLKLSLGKGSLMQRILPVEYTEISLSFLKKLLQFLNKTHLYVGVVAVAAICLHVAFMGLLGPVPALALGLYTRHLASIFWFFSFLALFSKRTQKGVLLGPRAIFKRHHDRHFFVFRSSFG